MTALTGAAFSATSFIVIRFLFGVGEAGAFPGATRAMQLWYPRQERGFVQGITHSASRAGAAIAPPIVLLIMVNLGWRWAFIICGAVGFLWALWWRASPASRRAARRSGARAWLRRAVRSLSSLLRSAMRDLAISVTVYGTPRRGVDGNLTFRAPSNEVFLDNLASCRAVFSTAGNQLVGEALWFDKPMLVMPEHTVEQRLNAAAVNRLGIGRQVRHCDVTAGTVARFLADERAYRGAMRNAVRDSSPAALSAIEGFARELGGARRRGRQPAWRFA